MPKKASRPIDLGFLQGDADKQTGGAVAEKARTTDLSSLFAQSVATSTEMQHATMIRIDRLLDNPYQPRAEIRSDSIEELASVIRSQGFQGVLVARPAPDQPGFYQLTAGHRRREAARRAGLHILPVVVRDLTDEEMVTLAITENIQREDLTPLEEGRIYLLMSDEMGFTHEQIAREVGRKRGYIENRIRVARAPLDVQDLIQAKPDSIRAVATLIKVKDPQERAEIIRLMLAGRLTVEDLQGWIAAKHSTRSEQASGTNTANIEASSLPATGRSSMVDSVPLDAVRTEQKHKAKDGAMQVGKATSEEAWAVPRKGGSLDQDERSAIRIGSAKLAAVLRYLNTYRDHSTGRRAVSEGERASLAHIKMLVDELHEQYVTEDEGRRTKDER
ncbi:MAG: ParB/RepB/Spo0J family partition protein [Chloroflexia bacterium]